MQQQHEALETLKFVEIEETLQAQNTAVIATKNARPYGILGISIDADIICTVVLRNLVKAKEVQFRILYLNSITNGSGIIREEEICRCLSL